LERIVKEPIKWRDPHAPYEYNFDALTKEDVLAANGDMHPPPLKPKSRPVTVPPVVIEASRDVSAAQETKSTWFLKEWEVKIQCFVIFISFFTKTL
jgi:hypothetical protein